jgi:hypothetical protein
MSAPGGAGTLACMPRYLVHHRHAARECGIAFASFKGHATYLRHRPALASCVSGDHAVWWTVEAPSEGQALALLPFFVAQRSTAISVTEVEIP